jgi:hypothetical protein
LSERVMGETREKKWGSERIIGRECEVEREWLGETRVSLRENHRDRVWGWERIIGRDESELQREL